MRNIFIQIKIFEFVLCTIWIWHEHNKGKLKFTLCSENWHGGTTLQMWKACREAFLVLHLNFYISCLFTARVRFFFSFGVLVGGHEFTVLSQTLKEKLGKCRFVTWPCCGNQICRALGRIKNIYLHSWRVEEDMQMPEYFKVVCPNCINPTNNSELQFLTDGPGCTWINTLNVPEWYDGCGGNIFLGYPQDRQSSGPGNLLPFPVAKQFLL